MYICMQTMHIQDLMLTSVDTLSLVILKSYGLYNFRFIIIHRHTKFSRSNNDWLIITQLNLGVCLPGY